MSEKKCACATLIIWDRLLSLRKDVIELKYNVNPEQQRDTWRHLETTAMSLLKGETPLIKRDCNVDLEESREKIKEAIQHRDLDRFERALRDMTFDMYKGVCI